ncbi:MAG: small acid-soluble spore protein SspI [Bacilli bacterium]
MDVNIRNHIINNFTGDSKETLEAAITESISENDEVTLPGMGVFFEIVWTDADQLLKDQILEILETRVKKKDKE